MTETSEQFLGPYRVSCYLASGVMIEGFPDEQVARRKLQRLAAEHPGAHITVERYVEGRADLELVTAITGQTI